MTPRTLLLTALLILAPVLTAHADTATDLARLIQTLQSLTQQLQTYTRGQVLGASTDTGLVAHWTFDDGSGTTAADSSGNGNTGTLVNSPAWTSGKVGGGALSFSGSNYVNAGTNIPDLSASTFSAWVYPTASGSHAIIDHYAAGAAYIFLEYGTYQLELFRHTNSVGVNYITAPNALTPNTWQLVTATWDGTVGSPNAVHIYVNGVEQGYSTQGKGAGTADSLAGGSLYIGAQDPSSVKFVGAIDDVRVYNRALSASEVADLYTNTGSGGGDTGTTVTTQTTYILSVSKGGSGSGTVSGGGISCGSTCSATANSGTGITLSATPSSDSTFTGWSGACSGTGSCTVTLSGNTSVTANFNTNTSMSYTASAYYFDVVNGSDVNGCTSSSPCQTLAKAITIAEARQHMTGQTTFYFAPGDYGQFIWTLPGDFTGSMKWTSSDSSNLARIDNLYLSCAGCRSNMTVDSFNIYQPGHGGYGVNAAAKIGGVAYLTLQNNEIHNEDMYDGYGINLSKYTNTAGTYISHNDTIQNNTIHDTLTGISQASHDTVIRNNDLYRIPGSMIGTFCGGNLDTSDNRVQSAWNVLIEGNTLHDSIGDYPSEPGYAANFSQPEQLHASVFSIRGSNFTIRNNRAWGINEPTKGIDKVWIQLYKGDCGISNYDIHDITVEGNIFYGSGYQDVLQTYSDVLTGPLIVRNNTIVNMYLQPNLMGNAYNGAGTEVYNNYVTALGIPFNAFYEAYDAPTAEWKMDHNIADTKGWIATTIDPSNVILDTSVTNGTLPANVKDTLFTAADFQEYSTLDCKPDGSGNCDWTPSPGSIICTAGRDGGYVGAVPCAGQTPYSSTTTTTTTNTNTSTTNTTTGGGGTTNTPTHTITTASTNTTAQYGGGGTPTTQTTTTNTQTTTVTTPTYTFTRSLKQGDRGADVKQLQHFLNTHGYPVATSGDGSLNNETTYFGPATAAALIRYQNAHAAAVLTPVGETRGTGYFGPSTIKEINRELSTTPTTATLTPEQRASILAQIQQILALIQVLQAKLAALQGN